MTPDIHSPEDHHDGTSDATPGGYADWRRPGEIAFAALLLAGSLVLLWNAYGISGFKALSAPGSIPMATAAIMLLTSTIILLKTIRLPRIAGETIAKDILPGTVILFVGFLIAYGLLLKPLGFLPTSGLFLILAIKVLSQRTWRFSLVVSLGSLILIWLVFRIVFTVLIPAGIVPEAEIIQFFRSIFTGTV